MSDTVWRRDEIESPCIKICVVHPEARLCMGCYRSLDEIRDWTKYDPETRKTLIAELPQRADQVKPRRKGGRNRAKPR